MGVVLQAEVSNIVPRKHRRMDHLFHGAYVVSWQDVLALSSGTSIRRGQSANVDERGGIAKPVTREKVSREPGGIHDYTRED